MLPKAKVNGIYNAGFIKKFIDSIIHYFFNDFINVG